MIAINELIFVFTLPFLATIPFALKVLSAFIFKNIEFKSQTFRYLRMNSIVDALYLTTFLVLPLTECTECFESNYWILFCKLFINFFISRALRTINALIILTIAWNQYRDLNDSRMRSRTRFYFTLITITLFSFLIYVPNLIKYNITNTNSTGITHYQFQIDNLTFKMLNVTNFSILFFIIFATICLNSRVAFKIRQQKNLKFKSIIFTSSPKPSSCLKSKQSITIQLDNSRCSQQQIKRLCNSQTKKLSVFITLVYIIDQVVSTTADCIATFKYSIFIKIFYFSIIAAQLAHIIVYYNFNKAFANRFKTLISCKKNALSDE